MWKNRAAQRGSMKEIKVAVKVKIRAGIPRWKARVKERGMEETARGREERAEKARGTERLELGRARLTGRRRRHCRRRSAGSAASQATGGTSARISTSTRLMARSSSNKGRKKERSVGTGAGAKKM